MYYHVIDKTQTQNYKLKDTVGPTVRYEVMKLCIGQQWLVLGGTESV